MIYRNSGYCDIAPDDDDGDDGEDAWHWYLMFLCIAWSFGTKANSAIRNTSMKRFCLQHQSTYWSFMSFEVNVLLWEKKSNTKVSLLTKYTGLLMHL